MKSDQQLCVLCGERVATTRDHVPPAGLFVSPRPSDLITVPACSVCNGGAAARDELFRNYVALQTGALTPSGRALWKQTGVRGIARNRKFLREVIATAEPVWLTSPAGIIRDRGRRIQWDTAVAEAVISRTVRGLYFHHFGSVLHNAVPISVQYYRRIEDEMAEQMRGWDTRVVGDGQFAYACCRALEFPDCSIWVLEFHGALTVGAMTSEEVLRESK